VILLGSVTASRPLGRATSWVETATESPPTARASPGRVSPATPTRLGSEGNHTCPSGPTSPPTEPLRRHPSVYLRPSHLTAAARSPVRADLFPRQLRLVCRRETIPVRAGKRAASQVARPAVSETTTPSRRSPPNRRPPPCLTGDTRVRFDDEIIVKIRFIVIPCSPTFLEFLHFEIPRVWGTTFLTRHCLCSTGMLKPRPGTRSEPRLSSSAAALF
jgi:hypothetical protein